MNHGGVASVPCVHDSLLHISDGGSSGEREEDFAAAAILHGLRISPLTANKVHMSERENQVAPHLCSYINNSSLGDFLR